MKIPLNWTKEQTLERLQRAHEQENELNKEIAQIDKLIKTKNIRKEKLRKLISQNMKYRNKLIELL
jgi:polyribonucleotide nucleotidyltransferase